MNDFTRQIRSLERYKKVLDGVQFVVSMKKDIATVRLGKRFRVAKCPSREFAETLTLALNTTIQTQAEKVKQIFDLLAQRCEQLEIDFNKTEDTVETPSGMV